MTPARMQLILIGIMAVWGLNISVIKVLTVYFDPLLVAVIRMIMAAVVINIVVIAARRPMPLRHITPSQWLRLTLCAILMVYINQIMFTTGMRTASATNSSIILALSPLAASVLAAFIFREALTGLRILGIALGLGGVFAVVFSGQGAALSGPTWGDALIFAAMLSFVGGGLLIQDLARQFNALTISCIIYTIGAVFLCVHVSFSSVSLDLAGLAAPGVWPWLLMIFSGVMATAVCNVIWNRAIAELGVARSSLFQYWIPIFGVGFALLLLGEPFSWWHLVGLVGILLGTYLGTRRPKVL